MLTLEIKMKNLKNLKLISQFKKKTEISKYLFSLVEKKRYKPAEKMTSIQL